MTSTPPPVAPAEAPTASIRVWFQNLPADSRRKLDEVLRGWAEWHAHKFLPGYVPPETVSGTLALAPDTAYAFEEVPAAPDAAAAPSAKRFNLKYEQAGGVPRYDRATDSQLHFSTRKRAASALLAAQESDAEAGAAGKPVKRLRASSRCFNCGSYGHSLRECWHAHNPAVVEESKRQHASASGASYRSAARRYYLKGAEGRGVGREQTPGEFAGLEPGVLTAELRAALGIGPADPPPWLQRMRQLGVPPGYVPVEAPHAPAATPAAEDGGAADAGAGDEGLAPGEEDGVADYISLGDSPDRVPHGGAAAAAAGAPPPEEFIALSASPGREPGGAAGGGAPHAESRVLFPGVNAPPPDDADQASWAPPPARTPWLPPAAAGTPQGFGAAGTPPPDRWQTRRPGSAERRSGGGGSGGRESRWQPLRGLHPPQTPSDSDASRGAGYPHAHSSPLPMQQWQQQQQQQQQQQPIWPPRYPGRDTPLPGAHAQPLGPQSQPPPPPADPPPPPPDHGQRYQPHYAPQWQQYALPRRDDLQGVSRSDPGHLLAFDQRLSQGGQQAQQAYAQPNQLLAQQAQQAYAQPNQLLAQQAQQAYAQPNPQQVLFLAYQPQQQLWLPQPQLPQQHAAHQSQFQSHAAHQLQQPAGGAPYDQPPGLAAHGQGSGGGAAAAPHYQQQQQQQNQLWLSAGR